MMRCAVLLALSVGCAQPRIEARSRAEAERLRCLTRAEAVAIARVERECPDLLEVCRHEGEILSDLARERAACPP